MFSSRISALPRVLVLLIIILFFIIQLLYLALFYLEIHQVLECFELQPDNKIFLDLIPIFPKVWSCRSPDLS